MGLEATGSVGGASLEVLQLFDEFVEALSLLAFPLLHGADEGGLLLLSLTHVVEQGDGGRGGHTVVGVACLTNK